LTLDIGYLTFKFMGAIFNTFLYQPLLNIFVALYNLIPGHDVGIVIIVITILLRIALYPLTNKSLKAQKDLQELQPKLEEIKTKYKDDKQGQAQATMELYKNNKVNPFASCLPLIVQLVILIALYQVLRNMLDPAYDIASHLYSFVKNPGVINQISFGFLNLAEKSIVLAVLAGAAQFWQAKSMSTKRPPVASGVGGKDEGMMVIMNKQMLYMMPVMTVFIGISLPAGLTLYWFWSTLLMALQQVWLFSAKGAASASGMGPTSGGKDGPSTGDTKVIEGKIAK